MSTIETERLLTVREAATRLRVTPATAYRWIHAGELPAVKVGGSLRVDPDELAEWLHAHSTKEGQH